MSETLPPSQPRSWIFQANPKLYNIDAALASLREMSWLVKRHKESINPGDEVFLWKSGSEGGILAERQCLLHLPFIRRTTCKAIESVSGLSI